MQYCALSLCCQSCFITAKRARKFRGLPVFHDVNNIFFYYTKTVYNVTALLGGSTQARPLESQCSVLDEKEPGAVPSRLPPSHIAVFAIYCKAVCGRFAVRLVQHSAALQGSRPAHRRQRPHHRSAERAGFSGPHSRPLVLASAHAAPAPPLKPLTLSTG